MYAFTGFVMSRHNWFPPGKNVETVSSHSLNLAADTTRPLVLAQHLRSAYEIDGRTIWRKTGTGQLEYTFNRPGEVSKVLLSNSGDSINITRNEKKTFGEIATRIHRIHGFEGGVLYSIWAIILDLAGLAAIVFALSGVVLWFNFRKKFWYGWLILTPTILLAIYLFFYLK
jgi:hypothetical protein